MRLYLTADQIGVQSGGGSVTYHESEALKSFGPCEVWGREQLEKDGMEPWKWDTEAKAHARWKWGIGAIYRGDGPFPLSLVHCYAGTFSKTIEAVQFNGCKVTYTAAAHSIDASRKEHEALGIPYNYPHLTDPEQWQRYLRGYLLADVLVCPSTHSADVMRSYGRTGPIEIIPHGCHVPEAPIANQPERFTVGYLGAYGPDKGVCYLLEAWRDLDYKDATLILGGRDSRSDWVKSLIRRVYGKVRWNWGSNNPILPHKIKSEYTVFDKPNGGSTIYLLDWVDNVSDFYNQCSLYVQPSVSEGFGCEVLEAMAHGRPVLVSRGAGAHDLVPEPWKFNPKDVRTLAEKINVTRTHVLPSVDHQWPQSWRNVAERYTWDKVRAMYVAMWRRLLCQK